MLEWLTQRAQPDLDWNYAMITLVVRFVAVFVVLWVIQAGMQLSAYFIGVGEGAETGTGGDANATGPASKDAGSDTSTPDDLTVAAIAIALELESQPEASRVADDRRTSAWAVAGRVTNQRR